MDYLIELINKMGDDTLRPGLKLPDGFLYQSELTVSWEAKREAGSLTDPKFIEPLKKMLLVEKDTERKINIIDVLALLAEKNAEHSVADFMLTFMKTEKVKWVRAVVLSNVSRTNLNVQEQTEYLFELIQDKDWQIVWPALELIKKLDASYSERIENDCLGLILKLKDSRHDLTFVCHALAVHGSAKSIEPLKTLARNQSHAMVINSALDALQKLRGPAELEFYIEIFQNKKSNEVKSGITPKICEFGDEKVIDLLVERVRTILSKERKMNMLYFGSKPEIVHILTFLLKFKDARVTKLIDFITAKKMHFLDKTELDWYQQNIQAQ